MSRARVKDQFILLKSTTRPYSSRIWICNLLIFTGPSHNTKIASIFLDEDKTNVNRDFSNSSESFTISGLHSFGKHTFAPVLNHYNSESHQHSDATDNQFNVFSTVFDDLSDTLTTIKTDDNVIPDISLGLFQKLVDSSANIHIIHIFEKYS